MPGGLLTENEQKLQQLLQEFCILQETGMNVRMNFAGNKRSTQNCKRAD